MCKYLAGITALFLFVPLAMAGLTDGLILYMPFDEGKGNVANDLSENHFVGDINGATWVAGKFGSALSFDGKGNFVEIKFADAFNIKEGITMAAWVTANLPFSPEWRIIMNAKKSAQGPWGIQSRAIGNVETFYDVGGVRVWNSSISTMEKDVFHHIAGTYSKENGFQVFFDGVMEANAANSGNLNTRGILDSPPAESVTIGHNYNSADRWWSGIIDEVVIYNRALSDKEMAQLFKAPPVSFAVESRDKLAASWGHIKRGS
jgi:hypothetical protein